MCPTKNVGFLYSLKTILLMSIKRPGALWYLLASILFTSCGEEPIDNGVEGTIEDLVTLKAIENAEVTTVPPTQSVLSDKDGKYQILDLDVGSYDLLVSANGYVKQKKGNIPVTDSFVTVNFQLKPSPDLVIDPMELVFSNNKNTLGLTIGRLSNRILKWRIDPNVIPTWLIVDPLSGETAAISSSVSVTVNRSKLPDQLQDHSTELVVRSNGGNVNIIITVTKDNGSSHLKIVPHRTGDVFVGDKPFAAPRQLVIVPRLRRAYITNSMANLITVVETFTDKVIRQIPINLGAKGLTLARGITHNPERGEIYIANFWQGTLSVVDALEMKEVEQLITGFNPVAISCSIDGQTLYIIRVPKDGGAVTMFDRAANEIAMDTLLGAELTDIAIKDGQLYVTDGVKNVVFVLDSRTLKVIEQIPVGAKPSRIVMSNDQKFGYVSNAGDNTISVINTEIFEQVGRIPTGREPYGIAVHSHEEMTETVYVCNSRERSISLIGMPQGKIVGPPITVGTQPMGIAILDRGKKVYVVNEISNDISILTARD